MTIQNRNYILGALPTAVLIIGSGLVYSIPTNPHSVLEDGEKCTQCHPEKPSSQPGPVYTFQKIRMRDNFTEVCTACHEYGERSHPTDIEIDFDVPADLPVFYGKVTCATCHYPHGESKSETRYVSASALNKLGSIFSRKKSFKTYFLRRENTDGELCLACHNR